MRGAHMPPMTHLNPCFHDMLRSTLSFVFIDAMSQQEKCLCHNTLQDEYYGSKYLTVDTSQDSQSKNHYLARRSLGSTHNDNIQTIEGQQGTINTPIASYELQR